MEEQLKVVITAETEKLQKEVKKAKETVEKFGDDSKKSFEAFDKALADAK